LAKLRENQLGEQWPALIQLAFPTDKSGSCCSQRFSLRVKERAPVEPPDWPTTAVCASARQGVHPADQSKTTNPAILARTLPPFGRKSLI
jgi:hypothetical protein